MEAYDSVIKTLTSECKARHLLIQHSKKYKVVDFITKLSKKLTKPHMTIYKYEQIEIYIVSSLSHYNSIFAVSKSIKIFQNILRFLNLYEKFQNKFTLTDLPKMKRNYINYNKCSKNLEKKKKKNRVLKSHKYFKCTIPCHGRLNFGKYFIKNYKFIQESDDDNTLTIKEYQDDLIFPEKNLGEENYEEDFDESENSNEISANSENFNNYNNINLLQESLFAPPLNNNLNNNYYFPINPQNPKNINLEDRNNLNFFGKKIYQKNFNPTKQNIKTEDEKYQRELNALQKKDKETYLFNSLKEVTIEIIKYLRETPQTTLDDISSHLFRMTFPSQTEFKKPIANNLQRRIYDTINVLNGLGKIEKGETNEISYVFDKDEKEQEELRLAQINLLQNLAIYSNNKRVAELVQNKSKVTFNNNSEIKNFDNNNFTSLFKAPKSNSAFKRLIESSNKKNSGIWSKIKEKEIKSDSIIINTTPLKTFKDENDKKIFDCKKDLIASSKAISEECYNYINENRLIDRFNYGLVLHKQIKQKPPIQTNLNEKFTNNNIINSNNIFKQNNSVFNAFVVPSEISSQKSIFIPSYKKFNVFQSSGVKENSSFIRNYNGLFNGGPNLSRTIPEIDRNNQHFNGLNNLL